MKPISKQNFYKMCKDIKYHVEKYYELPVSLTYDGKTYYQLEMAYAMAYGLFHLKQDFTIPNFDKFHDPNGKPIQADILLTEIQNQCKRVYNHIKTKEEVPNRVLVYKQDKTSTFVDIRHWIYYVAKVIVYYDTNLQLPNYCYYNSNQFVKPTPPKSYSEQIFDYFCEKLGTPDSIDGALEIVQDRGYNGYYDDRYTNKQTIDLLANRGGAKPNCTDIHHVFWHIGKVLDYDVRAVHVWCTYSDVGHVRLDFKKNNTGWFSRDASAVADGECIECIWCGNGELLAYNPNWFLSNLNR